MPIEYVQKLRQKYPEYGDLSDRELAQRFVTKYPEYQDVLGDVASGAVGGRTPEPPSLIQAAMEPFRRAGAGLVQLPIAVGRGVAGLKDVDYGQLLTEPGTTLEAAKEMGKQLLPAVLPTAGAIAGSAVGPAGTVAGAMGGEFLNAAIRQLASGRAEKPLDVLTEAATTGTGARLGLAVPKLVQQAAKATGRGAFREAPGIRESFVRQRVEPSLADISGSRSGAMAETGTGRLFGGAEVMQQAYEKTVKQIGDAFDRAKQALGPTGSRMDVGEQAVAGVKQRLDQLEKTARRLRQTATNTMGPNDFIGSDHLRAMAQNLYDDIAKANPGLQDHATMTRLKQLAATGRAPVTQATGLVDQFGQPITRTVQAGKDLTKLTLDEWYANNKELGRLARELNLIAEIPKGRAKALFRATMQDLEAAPTSASVAVKAFKKFYKEELVPFNESLPGQLASGQMKMEDVGSLFSRTGISQIEDVQKFAPKQFPDIRNRWLGDEFFRANVLDPQKGFQPGNFRNWWRRVDPEVKAKAFADVPHVVQAFDDLATIADRTTRKFSPMMGGGMSGTPAGVLPIMQAGATFQQGVQGIRAALAGDVSALGLSAGAILTAYLGPYGLAKLMTTPGGIKHLTTALKIPARSGEALAILSRFGLVATQSDESKVPDVIQRAMEGARP